MTPPVTPDRQV